MKCAIGRVRRLHFRFQISLLTLRENTREVGANVSLEFRRFESGTLSVGHRTSSGEARITSIEIESHDCGRPAKKPLIHGLRGHGALSTAYPPLTLSQVHPDMLAVGAEVVP